MSSLSALPELAPVLPLRALGAVGGEGKAMGCPEQWTPTGWIFPNVSLPDFQFMGPPLPLAQVRLDTGPHTPGCRGLCVGWGGGSAGPLNSPGLHFCDSVGVLAGS